VKVGLFISSESRRRLSKHALNTVAESIAFVPDLPDIAASWSRAVFDIARLRVAGPGPWKRGREEVAFQPAAWR